MVITLLAVSPIICAVPALVLPSARNCIVALPVFEVIVRVPLRLICPIFAVELIVTLPITCSGEEGVEVPIPTLPPVKLKLRTVPVPEASLAISNTLLFHFKAARS